MDTKHYHHSEKSLKKEMDGIGFKELFSNDFQKSQIYQLFKRMPKPANLHIHFNSFVSYHKIVYILINDPDLSERTYLKPNPRYRSNGQAKHFITILPNDSNVSWKLLKNAKDEMLDLLPDNIEKMTMSEMNILGAAFFSVIKNTEFYSQYWQLIIDEMDADNIYYSEIRLKLGGLHKVDSDGKEIFLPIEEELQVLEALYHKYDKRFRIIATYSRCKPDNSKFERYIDDVVNSIEILKDKKLLLGFDLVGDELECYKNYHFIENLKKIRGLDFNLYLHSGEIAISDQIDENILDAILLETTRIGHGINIIKYPELIKMAKKQKICLEIAPLSNYILWGYPLSVHPGISLMHQLPVVIGNDDPNKFGYVHLTYDYLVIFKYWALTFDSLKELLANSITYSSMTKAEKSKQMKKFKKEWGRWLKEVDT